MLRLVMLSLVISSNSGRSFMPDSASPSTYVYNYWYQAADGEDVGTDGTGDNILASVTDIVNSNDDHLLSSIYQDILEPVINETVKRKKPTQNNYEKPVGVTRNEIIQEKGSLNPSNTIFADMITPKTQKKVRQGISKLTSAIPHYQALIQYVVYIIGGTVVMSLPALG